jgi:hypothetical protein
MKFLFILFLLAASNSFGQTQYESPYSYNESTIQISFPSRYQRYKSPYEPTEGAIFSSDISEATMSQIDKAPSDLFMIMHIPSDNDEESLKEVLMNEVASDPTTVILRQPKFMVINGVSMYAAVIKVDDEDFQIEATYVAALKLGDVVFIVAYFSDKKYPSIDDQNLFKNVLNTINVVQTTKENQLQFDDWSENDNTFTNSLFDTDLSYETVFFDEEENNPAWNEWWDGENADRYLIAFKYLQIIDGESFEQGEITVFSAGSVENHPDLETKVAVLDQVYPQFMFRYLKEIDHFKNEELEFTEYLFGVGAKAPTMVHSIYSAIVNGELVFFVVEKNDDTILEFDDLSRKFISSFYYISEEEFEEE